MNGGKHELLSNGLAKVGEIQRIFDGRHFEKQGRDGKNIKEHFVILFRDIQVGIFRVRDGSILADFVSRF